MKRKYKYYQVCSPEGEAFETNSYQEAFRDFQYRKGRGERPTLWGYDDQDSETLILTTKTTITFHLKTVQTPPSLY